MASTPREQNLQFKELKQIVKETLTDSKMLEENMFQEHKEEIVLELLTYRLRGKLEQLGWAQLYDEPSNAV